MRASASDRIVNCPASLVLPRVREANDRRDDAAAYGTLVHHWMETGDPSPSWAADRHVSLLARKLEASGVRREDWWSGGEFETTWALNLRTLDLEKYSGVATGRDAWKESFDSTVWLTGTIDCRWKIPVAADDLKTGYRPAAEYNKQLLSYGVFLWLEDRRQTDTIPLSITHWPKYPINNLPSRHLWVAKAIDLEIHLSDLQFAIDNTDLEFYDGSGQDHCRFCESKKHCNEWKKNERVQKAI